MRNVLNISSTLHIFGYWCIGLKLEDTSCTRQWCFNFLSCDENHNSVAILAMLELLHHAASFMVIMELTRAVGQVEFSLHP